MQVLNETITAQLMQYEENNITKKNEIEGFKIEVRDLKKELWMRKKMLDWLKMFWLRKYVLILIFTSSLTLAYNVC